MCHPPFPGDCEYRNIMNQQLKDTTPDLFSYDEPDIRPDITGLDILVDQLNEGPLDTTEAFQLKTEAWVLQLAYANNKILSLSNSRTRILAHQVESTHRIVNSLKHRFMIADEVGLGKTIEAGLVIKEFIYRFQYNRILIACPASLLYQWQNEMKNKFNEDFIIMDRKQLRQARRHAGEGGNPWKVNPRIICSLDFIKNEDFADDLSNVRWDVVVFDEAHRLRRDSLSSTIAYTAAELLAQRTKALLLLSATPFRGKLEELFYLVRLIDPNVLGPFKSFYNEFCLEGADLSRLRKKLDTVIIRRTKKDIGGFTSRHASTIRFDLYPDERLLYDETTAYVVEEFNRAIQSENRAVGFVMTAFQKLLDSSTNALRSALKNRIAKLELQLQGIDTLLSHDAEARGILDSSDDESEDYDDLLDISTYETREELQKEIATLKRLVKLADSVEQDKKGEKLLSLVKKLKKKGTKKILIFTQFRTTQIYLEEILAGYDVVPFHGSMSRDEKEDAIIHFRDKGEILIATEAGGEGRNMQFCNVLINYDLPWSPLKIEQRIGRIHRFGQSKDVLIYNFSTRDTVAERVLEVLMHKLRLFEESIGTPDIMLGEMEDELKLEQVFMKLASGKIESKDLDKEIEARMNMARENYQKLGELTVADHMDFNYDEYYRITLKERSFSNRRIEDFIERLECYDGYTQKFIGRKNSRTGLYKVHCEDCETVRYGTFESDRALENDSLEFLAFGHPVVDSCIEHCQLPSFGGRTAFLPVKWRHGFHGIAVNLVIYWKGNSSYRELVTIVVSRELDMDDADDVAKMIQRGELERTEQNDASYWIRRVTADMDWYIEAFDRRLRYFLDEKRMEMMEDLQMAVDPEIEKVHESYNRRLRELDEKLQLQEGQMKWYGRDMKGAITRTRNLIMKTTQEKEAILKSLEGDAGLSWKAEAISIAVLAGSP